MNILITNDDGINSQGIIKLAEAAKNFGNVFVVAPDGQRSCISHCFTYGRAITLRKVDFPVKDVEAYSCDGTPADAVRIAVTKLYEGKIDCVMAGINDGYNISKDIQYSGTVAPAMEAVSFGIQAIAVSQGSYEFEGYADKYLVSIIDECIKKPLGKNKIWNINFPACAIEDCKGIMRDTKVSTDTFYDDGYSEEVIDEKTSEYSIIPRRIWEAEKGSDLEAIINNYISVGVVNNIG